MLITSKGNFRSRSSNAIEKKMQMGAPRPELFVHVSLRYSHYAFSLFDFLVAGDGNRNSASVGGSVKEQHKVKIVIHPMFCFDW
ncbi:hypothetical protein HID58_070114 [Brassica napus]|uniref:Uncharacterized protein n=1 Tax=Brassica napus TaxID=3708 RepID=A0ABQ7YXU0_BRANA|nr:hypothetical protein HID58_070114 [Brassica napus]